MRRQFTHIKQKDFALVKQLQGLGLKPGQVTQITKRSHATIGRIFKCETFGDYRLLMQELTDKVKMNKPMFTIPNLGVPITEEELNALPQRRATVPTLTPTTLESENIITPSLKGILEEIKITNTLLREIINSKPQKSWWTH